MPRSIFSSSIGDCAISWHGRWIDGFELPPAATRGSDSAASPEVQSMIARVRRHLEGDLQDFSDLCFDFDRIDPFQAAVLRATLAVLPGRTTSYGEIAKTVGQPAASRGVGAALGRNPWPLLIPCHRVVSADGKMTGFSGPGGIQTKLKLLALEGTQLFAQ